MIKRPRSIRRYPRRRVRIDVSTLRGHGIAIGARAERDEITILRCGKPYRMMIKYAYFAYLAALGGAKAHRKGQQKVLPRHRWRKVNQRYIDLHQRRAAKPT